MRTGDGAGGEAPAHSLHFDCGFPFVGTDADTRPLPRLPIHLSFPDSAVSPVAVRPVLDTGAAHTVFDGTAALHLGWTEADVVARAEAAYPIYGLSSRAPALTGYLHHVTCYIPLGRRFAVLRLRAFFTPPNTLSTPVLGRRDFFEQVDFVLVEAEQRCSLRVRDRSTLHAAWSDAE